MKANICKKCNAENKKTRYFCVSCGAFLKDDELDEKAYALPQMKIMRIVDNLRHMDFGEPVPDEAFEYQAKAVERLSVLYSLPEFAKNKQLTDKMKEFLALCHHPEFQIAFVGTIKTGKSTLINALLGKNYASMAVTPETAALTKFRVSPKDYVNIVFYTIKEWEQLWDSRNNAEKFMEEYNALNAESFREKWVGHEPIMKALTSDEVEKELSKWSSSKSPEHYFVKEIEVGISTLPTDFPPQVVFVDTPGLFDPVAYRSQITQGYIKRANAVFVCIDAQKIHQAEIKTIADVFSLSSHNKEKVHIIATHWDKLNNPDEDWKEQKEYLITQLTGKGFFSDDNTARSNILPTAAYIHNLCRDYEQLDKDDIKSLKKFAIDYDFDESLSEDRKKMVQKANVAAVDNIIKTKLAGKYQKLLLEDVEHRYINIRHDLQRIASDMKEDSRELLEASQTSLNDLKAKAEEKQKSYEAIQGVSNQLSIILDKVEKTTASQMDSICAQLRLKINPAYKRQTEKQQRSSLRKLADFFSRGKGGKKRK